MHRGVAAGVAVGLVAVNLGAVYYLREEMTTPPDPSEMGPPATLAPTEAVDTGPFTGPVLLAADDDGTVLRLTHGSCAVGEAEAVPAKAWVSAPDAEAVEVEVPGLVQTLALGADSDGWFVVGADDACAVQAWTAAPDGSEWQPADVPTGAWHLQPVADATAVESPRGSVPAPTGCTPSWVQAAGAYAYLLCEEGGAARAELADSERSFETYASDGSSRLAAIAVRDDGRVATIGKSADCAAAYRDFTDEKAFDADCLSMQQAGLGIAWAGDALVAQVGYQLRDQRGDSWAVRGETAQ